MEPNPNKDGEVEAPILLLDRIEADVERIVNHPKHSKKKIRLHAHPFIAAYLMQGMKSVRFQWYLKHKKWITVIPRDDYTYLHYLFFYKNVNLINL
jgi:ribonuclease G